MAMATGSCLRRDVTKVAQLEQMRRDFVGNVSHELRTPLTVIKGYLETILANAHKLDSRFQRPLEQMGQQAQRMETLLRDLLWLSRIESVRHTKKVERVNVAALLQELEDEMHTSHPDRTLNVELETEVGIPGDYRELHSAISNLVLNALKYSEPSTPVTIRWRQERGSAVLSVIDQGIGVAEAHIPRLTERFYRVDESRSSRTVVPGWDWPSSSTWRRHTRPNCVSKAGWGREVPFPWFSRWRR